MLVSNQQLTETQLHAVTALAACCQLTDSGLPHLYEHLLKQKRSSNNNVLFYRNDDLLGFLSVYFFYDDACEISLMVTPSHRRQGIARILLTHILPLLYSKQMQKVIFSMTASTQNDWLKHLGLSYLQSDYKMERHSYKPILYEPQLLIRKAEEMDIPSLRLLDSQCFPSQETSSVERFNHIMQEHEYTILVAIREGAIVGKAHIRWQTDGAVFSDIAITPTLQKKGLGGELLSYCINHSLEEGANRLHLDVEATNSNALSIYLRHGFKTVNQHDYWQTSIKQLQALLLDADTPQS